MTPLLQQDIQKSGRLLAFQPPPHWRVIPLGYLFESVGGGTPSKENEEYWSGKIPWISPKDMKSDVINSSEDHISEAALNETRLALLPASTILVVVRGMILVHTIPIAVTAIETTINQDMKGLFPKKGVTPEYFALLLRSVSSALFSTIEESGYGTRCLRLDLWRNILVGVPPEDEQQLIVRFVGERSAHLDALIEKKQKMIELLQEKRQGLISEAVRMGLDHSVSTKDSRVRWLGSTPAHWEIVRIKWVALMESGHTPDKKVEAYWMNCEIPWISLNDSKILKHNDYIGDTTHRINQLGIENSSARLLPPEAVVFSRDATIGLCAITTKPMAVSQHFIAWLCRERIRPEYLLRVFQSMTEELDRLTFGVTVKTIGMPDIRDLVTPLPPLVEQDAIVLKIRLHNRAIDDLVFKIHLQIKKLREYRQTLITAAVTGKVELGKERIAESTPSAPKPVVKANPYFRRTVFAAAIIDQLSGEPTFGHVKFQKCIYVAQHHLGLADFEDNYRRAAAGPYDNRLIRSIDSQLEKQGWFRAEQVGSRYTYRRLEKAGGHQKYFDGYFRDQAEPLNRLLDLFRPMNTDQAEIVATLYAVWNDFLIRGELFDDDRLVEEVLTNWDDTKKRFGAERWHKAIVWMREKGLVPSGFGRPTNADAGEN